MAGVAILALATQAEAAAPGFASTTDASAWQVAVATGGADGAVSSFPTSGFAPAVASSWRVTDGVTWIANNASGSNFCCVGNWTFFVFRQAFDLTGFDPATARLSFQWAGDDSGQGFAERGAWVPKYRLNGGPLVTGLWAGGHTYTFGEVTEIASGFLPGQNVLDFYVEGNGVTDGFALKTIAFTATPVPEPEALALAAAGLGVVGWAGLRGRARR